MRLEFLLSAIPLAVTGLTLPADNTKSQSSDRHDLEKRTSGTPVRCGGRDANGVNWVYGYSQCQILPGSLYTATYRCLMTNEQNITETLDNFRPCAQGQVCQNTVTDDSLPQAYCVPRQVTTAISAGSGVFTSIVDYSGRSGKGYRATAFVLSPSNLQNCLVVPSMSLQPMGYDASGQVASIGSEGYCSNCCNVSTPGDIPKGTLGYQVNIALFSGFTGAYLAVDTLGY